jgi:RecG-like helicase
MKKEITEQTFLNDVKDHKLEIINDTNDIISLKFKRPNECYYHFEITTWENHLCISGDMGTYVFKRVKNMFNFFRMDDYDFNYDKEKTLQINPYYWHQKLVSQDVHSPAMEFSTDLFQNRIKEILNDYCKENDMDDEFKQSCLQEMEEDFLYSDNEHEAREGVERFNSYDENIDEFAKFLKQDFWEEEFEDYSIHFIWCLYAIVWGIKQYDNF